MQTSRNGEGSPPVCTQATLRFDETNEAYHSDADWWSKTQLWGLRTKGPLWFRERYLTKTIPQTESDAMTKGSLIHLWAEIGDEAWWSRVAVIPAEFVGANGAVLKKGDDWVASQSPDAILLKPKEADAYRAQLSMIGSNAIFRMLTASTEHREFSIRWKCPDSGLNVRCRPDAATESYVWDLKTTKDQQPLKMFHKAVHDYGYGFQAAMYTKLARAAGFDAKQFVFVVSSTVAPYECHAVVLPEEYLAMSERHVIETCRDLHSRLALDDWSTPEDDQLTELFMPNWTKENEYETRLGTDRRE